MSRYYVVTLKLNEYYLHKTRMKTSDLKVKVKSDEKNRSGMWMKKRFSLFQNNHRNALTKQDKYIMQKQFGIQPKKLKTVLYCVFLKGFAIWVVISYGAVAVYGGGGGGGGGRKAGYSDSCVTLCALKRLAKITVLIGISSGKYPHATLQCHDSINISYSELFKFENSLLKFYE